MTMNLINLIGLLGLIAVCMGVLQTFRNRERRRRVNALESAILRRQHTMQCEHDQEEERGHRR